MALTYGTTGIKQKDYHVYIGEYTGTAETKALAYITAQTKTSAEELINALAEMGECRADSIDLGIADGDSIEGNVLGKIVLNKTGTFTAELINATVDNITALEELDGKACVIVLKERDARTGGIQTVIAMINFVVSYTEKITGSDSIRSTINIEKSVPSASAFRLINDIDFVT